MVLLLVAFLVERYVIQPIFIGNNAALPNLLYPGCNLNIAYITLDIKNKLVNSIEGNILTMFSFHIFMILELFAYSVAIKQLGEDIAAELITLINKVKATKFINDLLK